MEKEKKKFFTRKRLLIILPTLIVLFILIGISYAYTVADISYISKTDTKLKANALGLTYTGVSEVNCSNIVPGDKCIKTFEVQNTSNVETYYNIFMEKTTNGFDEDLVYTLEKDGQPFISETVAPVTKAGKTYVRKNITIAASPTKHQYKLVIEFKYDANKNQNVNQGKEFRTTLGIDTAPINGYRKYENGEEVYFNPSTNEGCTYDEYVANVEDNIATAPTIVYGCMRWYAFLDNEDSDSVNLLLDHIVSNEWNYQNAEGMIRGLYNPNYNFNTRFISVDDIVKITGADTTLGIDGNNVYREDQFNFINNPPVSGYRRIYPQDIDSNHSVRAHSDYGWIVNGLVNCYYAGCDFEQRLLSSTNFYTSTPVANSDSTEMWRVEKGGYISSGAPASVKPVITVKKNKLIQRTYDNNCKVIKGDGTKLGDVIRCYTEDFYVLKNDGTTISALAKYNLNIGIAKNPRYTDGLQAWTSTGYIADYSYNGIEVTSCDSQPDFNYVYNSNHSLYPYVTAYENYLKTNTGISNISGRLINLEEMKIIDCDPDYNSPTYSNTGQCGANGKAPWAFTTSYWTGVSGYGMTFTVNSFTKTPDSHANNSNLFFGLRPVIDIPVSDLN